MSTVRADETRSTLTHAQDVAGRHARALAARTVEQAQAMFSTDEGRAREWAFVSRDGRYVLLGDDRTEARLAEPGTVHLIDNESRSVIELRPGPDEARVRLSSGGFSQSEDVVYVVRQNRVTTYDLRGNRTASHHIRGSVKERIHLVRGMLGSRVILCALDGQVMLLDLDSGELEVLQWHDSADKLIGIEIGPARRSACLLGRAGHLLHLWIDDAGEADLQRSPAKATTAVAYGVVGDRTLVANGTGAGDVRVLAVHDGKLRKLCGGDHGDAAVHLVAFADPDDPARLVSVADDGSACLWRVDPQARTLVAEHRLAAPIEFGR